MWGWRGRDGIHLCIELFGLASMKVCERVSLWCSSIKLLLFDLNMAFSFKYKSDQGNSQVSWIELNCKWAELTCCLSGHAESIHMDNTLKESWRRVKYRVPDSRQVCGGGELSWIRPNNCYRLASLAQAHFNFALGCTRRKKTQRGAFNDGFLRESFVIVMYSQDFHSGSTLSRKGWKRVIN